MQCGGWKERRGGVCGSNSTLFKINLDLNVPSKSALVGRFRAGEMVSGWSTHIRHPCVRLSVPSPTTQPLSDPHILASQLFMPSARCEGLKEHQKQAENPTVYCAHGLNLDPYTYFEIKLYLHENHFKLHKYPEQIHLENCAFWAGFSLRSVCPPDQTIPFD